MYFNDFFLDQVLTVNKIYGTGLNIYEFFGTNVNTCITEIFGTAITFLKKIYVLDINIKRAGWLWPF